MRFYFLLFRFYEWLVERIEERIVGSGWRDTLVLNVVAQAIASIIILSFFGGLYLVARQAENDLVTAGIMVAVVVGLFMLAVIWRMIANWIEGVRLRVELDRTQHCPSCGRECSETTTVCPRCEQKIKR